MSPAPTRAELLETEKSLMRPAGIAALVGVLLFIASAFIQSSVGGESLDTDAELLTQYGEDGSTLLLGRIVFGLAFLCFTLPLYTLFRAVQARTDRVRNYYVAFCFIGPVLLAIQGPLLAAGYINRARLTPEQQTAIRYASAIVIYVSSTADIFLIGVAQAPWLPAVLAGLSIVGVMAGIVLRVRAFLYLGTAFLVVALLTLIVTLALKRMGIAR